jgi:hypothetical protein
MIIRYFTPNPLKGAFRACEHASSASLKSPLGDLGVILRIIKMAVSKAYFARHCEGEARSNPVKITYWIASPTARNDEARLLRQPLFV